MYSAQVHMSVVPAAIERRDAAGYSMNTSSQRAIDEKQVWTFVPYDLITQRLSDMEENTPSNTVYRSLIAHATEKMQDIV